MVNAGGATRRMIRDDGVERRPLRGRRGVLLVQEMDVVRGQAQRSHSHDRFLLP